MYTVWYEDDLAMHFFDAEQEWILSGAHKVNFMPGSINLPSDVVMKSALRSGMSIDDVMHLMAIERPEIFETLKDLASQGWEISVQRHHTGAVKFDISKLLKSGV